MGKPEEAAKAEAVAGISLVDLVAALKAATGNDEDSLRARARIQAEENEKLREWENKRHPAISVFSHPEGDVANPKDKLKCKMFWVGYPEHEEQLTPEEIAALNKAKPGEFSFKRVDGTTATLTVTGQYGVGGDLQRLEFTFPCKGTDSLTVPPKAAMLRQAFGLPSEEDALRAELAQLRKKVALSA